MRDALARYAKDTGSLNESLRAAIDADPGGPLVPSTVIDGARHNIAHRLDRLERRVVAAAKRREFAKMRDIEIARTSLFPLGKPQERVLNFIPMLARHGEPLLAQMREQASAHAGVILSGQASDASDERVGAPG